MGRDVVKDRKFCPFCGESFADARRTIKEYGLFAKNYCEYCKRKEPTPALNLPEQPCS